MVEQNMLGLFMGIKICPDSRLNSDHPRNCAFFESAFVSGIFWCGWFLPPQFNTLVWFCTWDRQRAMYKATRSWDRSKPVFFSGKTSILVRQSRVCFFPGRLKVMSQILSRDNRVAEVATFGQFGKTLTESVHNLESLIDQDTFED